jgi:predicted nucleic acid-binding Zn ribbon protein
MTFRKTNEITLGEAIQELIKTYNPGSKRKLSEARMIGSWDKVVGTMIAGHTTKMWVHQRKLYVEVDSAALRQELTYSREKIKKSLIKLAGEDLIDEVVFR